MASQGPNTVTTAASDITNDNASGGTDAWSDLASGKVLDGFFTYAVGTMFAASCKDYSIKLVVGGTITGSDYADTGTAWNTDGGVHQVTYGGATDKWGLTPTAAQINGTTFGVVLSAIVAGRTQSQYLKSLNFGFTIPDGATIDGIVVDFYKNCLDFNKLPDIDSVQITVYYTAASSTDIKAVIVVAEASISKIDTIARASIAKVAGLA